MAKRIFCAMLAALLLAGCSAPAQEPEASAPPQTTAQPAPQATPPETTAQPEEPALAQGTVEAAPGMVTFYIGQRAFYCGQAVAGLLEAPAQIQGDVQALVEPMGYSAEIRLRLPDEEGKYTKTLLFVAVNPGQEPAPVKDCLIYSLAVNCEAGHRFGLGEAEFVTGQTTDDQILAAWGQPFAQTLSKQEGQSDGENYRDMVYYQPLSYLQIISRGGVVDQVRACHNAYLYPELAQQEPIGTPGESDALLFLSRYMDVTPYLNGGKGGNTPLEMAVTIAGEKIAMGIRTYELPQPWRDLYQRTTCIMKPRRCVYAQRTGQEGFIFGNPDEPLMETFSRAQIKGVYAFNPEYTNRGFEQESYRGFAYAGFDHTSTIEDVLAALGQPHELIAESGAGWCFVWLHYQSEAGDTLRLKVDPESNQLIELRLEENSRFYFYP